MRLIPGVFSALFLLASAASAEDVENISFDMVEGLEGVKAIAFDSETDTFFATLEDRSLHFSLFPLRLRGEVSHKLDTAGSQFKANGNGVGPKGDLIVVGEKEETKTGRSLPLGAVLAFPDVRAEGLTRDPKSFPLEIAPLSAVSFDEQGNLYLQSASHHSVVSFATESLLGYKKGGFSSKAVPLGCGPTMKFSVLEDAGSQFYVSSVNTKDVLEIGKVSPSELTGSCIDGERLVPSTKSGSKSYSAFSVKDHSLIQRPSVSSGSSEGNGILIFDSTTSQLSFFPIAEFDGNIALRRSSQVSIDLTDNFQKNTSQFGLLSTDSTGDSILVAGFDRTQVHRLTWDGEEFEYLGAFEMGASVKNLYTSKDGEYAAIVTGAPNGESRARPENEITLIRLPSAIPKNTPIGADRYSVAKLQQELRNSGDKEVLVDGVLGPQTMSAIERYKNTTEPMRSVSDSSTLDKDSLIKGIFPNWPETSENN